MSSRDRLVPLVKAVLGLGIASVDGMGDFSLNTSGVGWEGWHGGVSIEGVEGVVEYFQELFRVWVVFFDLGVNGDWMRVWWWCVL